MTLFELPQFFGFDHFDSKLNLNATDLISQYGANGRTLFIEGTAKDINQNNRHAQPYYFAVKKALEIGMNVVFLDDRIKTIVEKKGLQAEVGIAYPFALIRERNWFYQIKKWAKKDDIVLIHPLHLQRMILEHPEINARTKFISSRPKMPRKKELKTELTQIKNFLREKRRRL
ncbi:MAG: hypothetical protein Q7S21_01890 [archaeon]|nr:hypothetical protein [archaeon]